MSNSSLNKKKEHKHTWHFVEKWNTDWKKTIYKFVCDCGKIKVVNEKL